MNQEKFEQIEPVILGLLGIILTAYSFISACNIGSLGSLTKKKLLISY